MANKTKNDLTLNSTLSAVKPYDVVYRNWLIMPIVLLFLGLGIVIFQADGALSKAAYWQPQVDTFLWLNNHVMTVIPRDIWGNISMLGDSSVLLMALSPILLYRPQIWLTMIAAAPLAGLFATVGKRLLAMPRPGAVLEPEQFLVIGDFLTSFKSLPSGHTITVFTGMMVLIIGLFPKITRPNHAVYIGLGVALAALMGLARVAVGAHWHLDILFGASLGWIAAVSGVAWVNRCHRGWLALLSDNGLLLISALLYICSFVLFLRAYIGVSSGWQMLIIAGVCGVSVASVLLVQQIIAFGNDDQLTLSNG